MCFSAEASFISGTVISVIGIVALKKTKTIHQKFFAAIPLLFGIQQITEGFLWLTLKQRIDPGSQQALTYAFIIIAQVIWPTWVPLSILLLEKKPGRRKILWTITGIGAAISATIVFRLLFYPVSAEVENHHILYHLKFPQLIKYLGAASYFIATVVPCFASSVKKMHLLGLLILASYIIALVFFTKYAISVWCFFAATISVIVYIISRDEGNLMDTKNPTENASSRI